MGIEAVVDCIPEIIIRETITILGKEGVIEVAAEEEKILLMMIDQ
jgi:hypothetical protein